MKSSILTMNLKLLLLVLSGLILKESITAQCDYLTPRYNFKVEKKILYGILPDYQNAMDSLFVDVYTPIGAAEVSKPLVIWAFGGGFFQGKREDFAAVCEELAKRGFVTATIDYRLGFDGPYAGLNPPFAYDAAEILRAGYRGATDMKGAIRFLKGKHLEYGIDLDRIWIGGASAGAIVALNAAFLDKDSEKPKETGAITPIANKQRPDLGPINGLLNLNGYDDKVQGVFNIFGALIDTSSISAEDRIAVFSYHQENDPVVPCLAKTPYYQIPFISSNYPIVYGSCMINDRFKHMGLDPNYYETWIYSGNQHATHDEAAVINYMIEQAKPFLCKTITAVGDISLVDAFVSPNPAYHSIQIQFITGDCNYSIIDISGNVIQKDKLHENHFINIANLHAGLYFIKLQNNTQSKTLRWMKL
ncbi:MAG: T9SS type A sorting domain-containing protein [Saprospiraceae bacterium]|nr:T9SS type A sorting domain-containing protein [Saprospiraceae bacterium]MBK9722028.1 T9SS type A sorting domain-containing protein [Saprospiraceae bacterium]